MMKKTTKVVVMNSIGEIFFFRIYFSKLLHSILSTISLI